LKIDNEHLPVFGQHPLNGALHPSVELHEGAVGGVPIGEHVSANPLTI
jgi:hypothetical protein